MVFQNYALYPHMTVRDNMAFSLTLAKAPKAVIEQRGRSAPPRSSASASCSIAIRASSRAASASASPWAAPSCAIRRSSCSTSRCPTSTPSCACRCAAEIKELHQRLKVTTVYVTHDQIEAMTMADKIVVMNGGNVEQIGAPLELYDRPANLFVAGFIGSPAMNFLRARSRAARFQAEGGDAAAAAEGRRRRRQAGGLRRAAGAHPARPQAALPAKVHVVEPTGSETQVLARLPATRRLCAFRERVTAGPGDTIRIRRTCRWCICSTAAPAAADQPLNKVQSHTNRENPGMTLITRRERACQLGRRRRGAVRHRCHRHRQAFAQSRVTAARRDAAAMPIEKGATLRMLRPARFVRAGRGRLPRRSTPRLHQGDRRRGRGWTSWAGRTSPSRPPSPPTPAPAPTSSSASATTPHIYADKLVELSDVAEYLGKKYGGWMFVGEKYGKGRHQELDRPALRRHRRPVGVSQVGGQRSRLREVPDRPAGFLELCQKLKKAGKPFGFALGNAVGDANGFANWLLWTHGGSWWTRRARSSINSPETIAALKYAEGTVADLRARHAGLERHRQQPRLAVERAVGMTSNGVSLYFSLKNDRSDRGDRRRHRALADAGRPSQARPSRAADLNAMVFKHSQYPNAAKAYLQFMMEQEQYEPWLSGCLGYWCQPLEAYRKTAVWTSDPKIAIFRDSMNNKFCNGYKGPIAAGLRPA